MVDRDPHRDRQGLLFGPPSPIQRIDEPRAGYSHRGAGPTEKRAAVALRPISGRRRRQVYEAIRQAGDHGITRQEIADLHEILLQSVCSAVASLKAGRFIVELRRERAGRRILIINSRRKVPKPKDDDAARRRETIARSKE